jgi:hypothetical protein
MVHKILLIFLPYLALFEKGSLTLHRFSIRLFHGKLNFNFFGWNILLAKSINPLKFFILDDTALTIKATYV